MVVRSSTSDFDFGHAQLVAAEQMLLHAYSRAQLPSGHALDAPPEPGRRASLLPSTLVRGDQHARARGAAVNEPKRCLRAAGKQPPSGAEH